MNNIELELNNKMKDKKTKIKDKMKKIPTVGQKIMELILPYESLVKYEALGQEIE